MNDDEFDQDERAMLAALGKMPPVEPPGDIRERFRERAETDKAVGPGPARWVTAALAAALILALGGGWWTEHQAHNRDATALRSALISALADLSAAKRLNAVNEASNAGTGDRAVVAALTQALLSDSNVNVRVAAAKALGIVAGSTALAEATVKSARVEASPFVQNALLTVAAEHLSATNRASVIHELLNRHDIEPSIRIQAEQLAGSL